MKQKEKVFVVVNPTSGGGKGHTVWPRAALELKKRLGSFDFEETTSIGHAQVMAADAAKEGYTLVIAFGGDGTVHEVANGLMEAKADVRPALGIISTGTGGDFVRTLELPAKLEDQVRIACGSKSRRIDLGKITYVNAIHQEESRYFINIANAGIGAEVVKRTPKYRSFLGRKPAYLAATLAAYARWKPKKVTIETEHGNFPAWPEKPVLIVLANGKFFGGGMPIAPRADASDGYLDLVVLEALKAYQIPLFLPLLYSKHLQRLDAVHCDRVRRVRLTAEARVDLDIDGEPVGSLPADIEIVPSALEVKIPA